MTLTALVVVAVASLLSFALAWFVCQQTRQSLKLQMEREGNAQELETRLEEQRSRNQKALMQLQENKEALKQEFKHLAHEIFEARGKVLSDQHHEQLHSLLAPFKEQH